MFAKSAKIFALPSSASLVKPLVARLGLALGEVKIEVFSDGEKKVYPLGCLRDDRVIVFQSLAGEPNRSPDEKIMELLFFLHALQEQRVRESVLIAPYLAYSRSDQKHSDHDPLFLKALATLLESAGLGEVVTFDVHNLGAYQNAFRTCLPRQLEASSLFCHYFSQMVWGEGPILVLSPDFGGIRRADGFRIELEQRLGRPLHFAFLEKFRKGKSVEGSEELEKARGAEVLIFDDIISTGNTVLRAMEACERSGAKSVTVAATHGIFSGEIEPIFRAPLLRQLVVTDTNPKLRHPGWESREKLKVLSCTPILEQYLGEYFQRDEKKDVA